MIPPDACATPGCGHSKQQHNPDGCHYIGVVDYVWGCSCTAYLPLPSTAEGRHPMTDDLNRLRAVAEAATPGPWRKYNDGVVGFPVDEETGEGIGKGFRPAASSDTDYDQRLLDAIYVATFDPPTVLALLDRAERAETERDEIRQEIQNVAGGALIEEAEASVRRIHAEVERDVARQALTSSDAMDRHWDEINAERDRLHAERDAARADLAALRAAVTNLADEWDATALVLGGTNRKPVPRWFSQRLRAALLAAAPTETEGENT